MPHAGFFTLELANYSDIPQIMSTNIADGTRRWGLPETAGKAPQ